MNESPADPKQMLSKLSHTLESHLTQDILPFWYRTIDHRNGGFAGLIKNDGSIDWTSPKGIVMHARHLWAYSLAWTQWKDPQYLAAARHAYQFISHQLYDPESGGFWWTIDTGGKPNATTKVLYGQAFAIYGFAQYFLASQDQAALDMAMVTFDLIEKSGRDHDQGGYFEAVDRPWTTAINQALSEIDLPCAKSMNTNLHVLEAYTCLFQASQSPRVRAALEDLLQVFETRILANPSHLGLYFTADWQTLSDHVSYGHDIEASWLMTEAARVLFGHNLPELRIDRYLQIARTTLQLLQENGGSLPNELHHGQLDTDRHWWVQAEALVGMVNAWELSQEIAFLEAATRLWAYIEQNLVDHEHGEWFWLVDQYGRPGLDRPKGGLWKTCYHNGRSCMEVVKRAAAPLAQAKVAS